MTTPILWGYDCEDFGIPLNFGEMAIDGAGNLWLRNHNKLVRYDKQTAALLETVTLKCGSWVLPGIQPTAR